MTAPQCNCVVCKEIIKENQKRYSFWCPSIFPFLTVYYKKEDYEKHKEDDVLCATCVTKYGFRIKEKLMPTPIKDYLDREAAAGRYKRRRCYSELEKLAGYSKFNPKPPVKMDAWSAKRFKKASKMTEDKSRQIYINRRMSRRLEVQRIMARQLKLLCNKK